MGLKFTLKALLPEFDFADSVAAIPQVSSDQHCQRNEYGSRCRRKAEGYLLL